MGDKSVMKRRSVPVLLQTQCRDVVNSYPVARSERRRCAVLSLHSGRKGLVGGQGFVLKPHESNIERWLQNRSLQYR
jgi:hypothetical protein